MNCLFLKHLPEELHQIVSAIHQNQGHCILVGGAVRDYFLNQTLSKDLDIEVYQIDAPTLEKSLKPFGRVAKVGKSFGVFKLFTPHQDYDFSVPRTENKVGIGHKGFEVHPDPFLSFEEASKRRDFTMNAMGLDLKTGNLLDPHQGQQDLQKKCLRHVSAAFTEDPLRVLRAMQFCGRFELQVAPQTQKLCQSLDLSELPKERIFEEFKKLLLLSTKPSMGLQAAQCTGVLDFFPELQALIGVPQDPQWHPEGDVWTHTLMVLDEAAHLRKDSSEAELSFMLGALCHDFGKPQTTKEIDGRWRSLGHEAAGEKPTRRFLQRLTDSPKLIETVVTYVKEHLKPALLHQQKDKVSDAAIRRLALRVSITEIIRIAKADHFGRTTSDAKLREFPAGDWLLERAKELDVHHKTPTPLLKGRHLIELNVEPGPLMGEILKQAFQEQLDGHLLTLEAAIEWAHAYLQKPQLEEKDQNG